MTWAPAALALAPDKTGWWNTATVAGTALPATTADGDLHVAGSPGGSLAFAALSFRTAPYGSAALTLTVVPRSQVGTPQLLACPTTEDRWKAGGDQPAAAAPSYECAGRSAPGTVATDAAGTTTVTFVLDAAQQLDPTTTSVAVVPDPAGNTPFSADLAKPTPASLKPAAPSVSAPSSAPAAPYSPPAGSEPAGPAAQPATDLPGKGVAQLPGLLSTTPLTAGQLPPAVAPSSPAVVAPTTGTTSPQAGPPVATRVAEDPLARRASVVLLLALVTGLAYLAGDKQTRAPRLIGGRALHSPAASDDGLGTARVGGIGRFARARTAAPRRLT